MFNITGNLKVKGASQQVSEKFKKREFVITDNNSKFGTLIKLVKPIPLTYDKVAVQIGRTVITLVIK